MNIVVFGHSGAGKSTTAALIRAYAEGQGRSVAVLKLAQPLYELQQEVYRRAGKTIGLYDQDQVLLEALATHLRRISPTSFVDDFARRLACCRADVVITDDLRDPSIDYPFLQRHAFTFLRIHSPEPLRLTRLSARADHTAVVHSSSSAQIDQIVPDFQIENDGDVDALRQKVSALMARLL